MLIYNHFNNSSSIGTSIINYNSFDGLNNGVRADRANIYFQHNDMSNIENGVFVKKAGVIVINDNEIIATDVGVSINSCDSDYLSDYLFSLYDNTIGITTYNTGKAINVQMSDEMNIHDNDISMHGGEAGIFVRESDEVSINDNVIELYGGEGDEIDAIHLEGSENLEVKGNTMNQGDFAACCVPSNKGIYSTESYGRFVCNKMNKFSKGMHFIDDCDESELHGNKYNLNSKDLVLGTGGELLITVIGQQGDFDNMIGWGNKWYYGNNNPGGSAYNYSPYEYVEHSKFIVNSSIDPAYKPQLIVAENDEWFYDDVSVTNEAPCFNNPVGPPIGPTGFDCDDIVGMIIKVDTSNAMDDCQKAIWKYHYFKKLLLMKKMNLLVGDCTMFFDNNEDNVLVQIAKVDSAITNILINRLADYKLYNYMENIRLELDKLYDRGDYNTPKWDETMKRYSQLLTKDSILVSRERELDIQKIDSVKKVINTIAVRDLCLKILLMTYDIELDYIKSDTLTSRQRDYINEVSVLCPIEYGDGVFIARALRSLYENVRYESVEDCTSGKIKSRDAIRTYSNDKINIAPNPAIDEFGISIDLNPKESGMISIVNLSGQELMILKVASTNHTFNINTKDFVSGVYLIRYVSNTGEETVKKLVISK